MMYNVVYGANTKVLMSIAQNYVFNNLPLMSLQLQKIYGEK